MRVGFVTQLLWSRYGQFWRRLFEEAGAEIIMPPSELPQSLLDLPRVANVPGLAFRLAVAQALAVERADVIVAPSLNYGSESQRGGGQDPWVADFPGALGTLGGLPPIMAVPAWLSEGHESLVIECLHQVGRDMGRVRRIWSRHRSALKRDPLPEPRWAGAPAGGKTVGVLAQPWLLTQALASRAVPGGAFFISQHHVDPFRLREEGRRVDPLLLPTDQEVLGAARLFARRGSVDEIHLIVDESSGPDRWLLDRVSKLVGEHLVVHGLSTLLGEDGLPTEGGAG